MPTGSQVLLTRNAGYMRCCPDDPTSNLYRFSYADFKNLGRVDIIDIASVASRFGQPDPYWVNSNIAPGTTVNIEDVAVVAFYFDNGITRPFTPSQLTDIDPQIDPFFFCANTGCYSGLLVSGPLTPGNGATPRSVSSNNWITPLNAALVS